MNRAELIGRLGNDPDQKGKGLFFSVATNENYKDKDGNWQSITEWHKVAVFKDLPFQLNKGDNVYISGKIKTNKVEDKYYTSIVVDLKGVVEKLEPHQKRASLGGADFGGYEPEPNNEAVPF